MANNALSEITAIGAGLALPPGPGCLPHGGRWHRRCQRGLTDRSASPGAVCKDARPQARLGALSELEEFLESCEESFSVERLEQVALGVELEYLHNRVAGAVSGEEEYGYGFGL